MVHTIVISQKAMDINILSVKKAIFFFAMVLIYCYESPVIRDIHMLLLQFDSLVIIVTIVLYYRLYFFSKVSYDSPV